ncbi:FUSC family protein [Microvirga massiliensis]|uniref:FUSC family protein n=1 Tax=Microvirga massiliensis TaxID=1033741 RepID=UPI00069BE64D|nr:FUSC family protein [Microvirga massiliensis]
MTGRDLVERWSSGWRDALAAAVGAGASWWLAQQLLGHPHPVFAAVAAIVCLSPGLPSRRRQAVNMVLGVVTGIVVGELLLQGPVFAAPLQIALITFLAIMAAVTFGPAPVISIQAAVSALLVLALGPTVAGPTRLADVAVGAAVGLAFSQVLLTPDPVRLIDGAARRFLHRLAQGLADDAQALAGRDRQKAHSALDRFLAAHDSLDALEAGITKARSISRWSVRGRLAARDVAELAARHERRAIGLYASTLLFGEAVANALRGTDEPPSWLGERVADVASLCEALAGGQEACEAPPETVAEDAVPPPWRACIARLHAVEERLRELRQTAGGPSSPAAG